MHDLVDPFPNRQCRVERDHVVQVCRESPLHLLHQLLRPVHRVDRVGSRELVNGHDGRGFAIEPADHVVILSAKFDPGDILEPHNGPVAIGPDDDLLKFFSG